MKKTAKKKAAKKVVAKKKVAKKGAAKQTAPKTTKKKKAPLKPPTKLPKIPAANPAVTGIHANSVETEAQMKKTEIDISGKARIQGHASARTRRKQGKRDSG